MSPEENLAYFEAIKAQVSTAAVPAADGMAKQFDSDVGRVLRMHFHAPMPAGAPHKRAYGIFYKATSGAPPSFASGDLAASMVRRPASGGIVASALVGNTAVYAAVQEFGLDTWTSGTGMRWHNDQGWWKKLRVKQNEHPYFRKALELDTADGSLSRAAMEGFAARVTLLDG